MALEENWLSRGYTPYGSTNLRVAPPPAPIATPVAQAQTSSAAPGAYVARSVGGINDLFSTSSYNGIPVLSQSALEEMLRAAGVSTDNLFEHEAVISYDGERGNANYGSRIRDPAALDRQLQERGYTVGWRDLLNGQGAMYDLMDSSGNVVQSARSGEAYDFMDRIAPYLPLVLATAGLMAPAAGGAGAAAEAGAAGGAGAGTSGAVAAGNGAFLGEGVASGIGAWDAAAGIGGAAGAGGGAVGAGMGSSGNLAPLTQSGVVNTGIGDAVGAASAQGTAGGLTSAEAASLYGSAGYGPGMTGWQTTLYDGAINAGMGGTVANMAANGGGALQTASNFLGGSGSTSGAGSLVGGNGNWMNLAGNLASGYMQSRAADRASDAQQQAAREANQLQRYMSDTTRADFAPWREAGVWGLGEQRKLLEDPTAITRDPSYAFGLNEGRKSFENSAAARGGLFSGATLKALERYGQDYGGTKLNEAYNRYAGLSGTGQQATGSVANAGQNYANNASQNMLSAGNSRAAGYVGQSNAWTGAIGNALSNYQQQPYYNALIEALRRQQPAGG